MNKFNWGAVIEKFDLNFDGEALEIIKYHPRLVVGNTVTQAINETEINYHVEELHASYGSMFAAVIAWITFKQLGLNQYALVSGLCKALEIDG
jgi:hypothetical protein